MNKKITTILLSLMLATACFGAKLTQKQLQFCDEWGKPVNLSTSVSAYIYDVGTTTAKSIYLDIGGNNAVTQPITDDSTNTCFLDYANGRMQFWSQGADYKITITDGTYTRTVDNLNSSDTRMMWPTFLIAMSSYSLGQNEDLDFTYGAWVIDGDSAGRLDFIPDSDGGIIAFGDGTTQGDMYIYESSTEYLFFDEGNGILNAVSVNIDLDDDAYLRFGSSDDIQIKYDGSGDDLDITGDGKEIAFGATSAGMNIVIWADTASEYVKWDEAIDTLSFVGSNIKLDDSSILYLGTKTNAATADGDVTLQFDGTNLELFATAIDTPFAIGGTTTNGFDITYYFETAGQFRTDYDADFINLTDDMELRFGTGATSDGDLKISSNSSNILQIEQVVLDTGTIEIGVDNRDIPIKWYAETASSYFQLTGDDVNIEAMNLALGDGDAILLGDALGTGDFTISSTNAVLTIAQISADTGTIVIGASGTDVPITWNGETAGAEITLTGDTAVFDGIDTTVNDDDFINFGDNSEVTLNYDEDGDNDLQVKGPVDFETTYCLFGSNPVVCKNDGTAVAGATGETDFMAIDGVNFEYFILGLGQTIKIPTITANGLDVRLDAIDDEGMELGEGITARSKSAFVVGTDAFYLKVKVYITDVNDFDIMAVGFRLAAAYGSDLYAYNTYAGINVNNGAINGIDELNGAAAHETDMGEVFTDATAHTLEVRVSAAKAVTQYLDGAAVSTPLAFTWTDTDTVVPFFHVLGDASAAGEVAIQLWECGLQ